jgi:phage internal scaffolding protein
MTSNIQFQTPYNRKRCPIDLSEGGRTEQSHKSECDINNIIRKYDKTGLLVHRNEHRGEYGFVDARTYTECMNVVAKAKTMFEELPAKARDKFGGDPARFLDFVQNPNNAEAMVQMGLAHNLKDIASQTIQKDKADLEYVKNPPNKDGGKPSKKAAEGGEN